MTFPEVILKEDRQRSLERWHPWIFSGAIQSVRGNPENGHTVRVLSSQGNFLAWGALSVQSQIRVRIWSWDEADVIDRDFFRQRLEQSLERRRSFFADGQSFTGRQTTAMRLVHGESDDLPGLVVDRYGESLVVQILSSGAEYWKDTFFDLLPGLTGAQAVFERSDVDVRALEGLPPRRRAVNPGANPRVKIIENGASYWVDILEGQKTGFYLDQRANRQKVRAYVQGREVLDCFAYSGGFTINSLLGGAKSVTAVDNSEQALELLRENLVLNQLQDQPLTFQQGDVFQVLRSYRDARKTFDMIILDPPKFAHNHLQVEKAARGYKDINLLAFKLLRPGGILATFSCSGGISMDLFQKIVAGAALDAKVNAKIIEHLHQDADHPIATKFPEGEYLKGLMLAV